MPTDEEYLEKGKVYACELGLDWEEIVDAVDMCNYMRAVTLEWLYNSRGLLEMRRFKDDMRDLREVAPEKRRNAFLNLGYKLPEAVERYPNLFFDFWIVLRELVDMYSRV